MHVQCAIRTDLLAELTDALQEREALDVAHRAPDLADHDVVALGQDAHRPLDLVGDVGYDLHRASQVVATPLPVDDRAVDAPRRRVVLLRQVRVDKALVVAQVEVRLGSVLGHEDFAMLERRKRSRVDVYVGVELLQGNAQPALLEQNAQ